MAKPDRKNKSRDYGGFRVIPDSIDLRDRMYAPSVSKAPPPALDTFTALGTSAPKVRNQRNTRACTGFALAAVIDTLLAAAKRSVPRGGVSAMMLYSMARKYDEFRGDALSQGDAGSSVRGAMKGWHRHGAARAELWPDTTGANLIPSARDPGDGDWWAEAVARPLGAYYRIDFRSVTDMHVATLECGAILASALTHTGWQSPRAGKPGALPVIAAQKGTEGWGHAFAIVGYNDEGFIVLNSYGREWGLDGRAVLRYEDWIQNAMDCWVAQLGVVTRQHEVIASAATLRISPSSASGGGVNVVLSSDPKLADHEIEPFVIDMENNGCLSPSGRFRTSEEDVRDLMTRHLGHFKQRWKIADNQRVKVGIYAHGGLVGEEDAAKAARVWIPAMYESGIFPIFLMWETDLFSTLKNRLADVVAQFLEPKGLTGGLMTRVQNWWDDRIEQTVSRPGAALWDEIKQNGAAISTHAKRLGGGQILYDIGTRERALTEASASIHLIGHSAGSIVHAHIVDELVKVNRSIRSIHFMAPAITMAGFNELLAPRLRQGRVKEYHQYHLTDEAERNDQTCRPILGYGKSLLYLVSNACEGPRGTPLLGMEKFATGKAFADDLRALTTFHKSPGSTSRSSTHGGFDDDETTRRSILRTIAAMKP